MAADDPFAYAPESDAFAADRWDPLPVRDVGPGDDAVPALLAWAAGEGAWFEPIEIAIAADGNRTVRARRAVAAGEPLITVPRHLMLTDDDVEEHPLVGPVAYLEGEMASPPCTMGVWLALAQAEPPPRWRRYLDALPQAFPWMAIHQPAPALAALTGTRALAMVAYKARGHRADHALVGRAIRPLAGLSLADHVWGRLVAASRSFRIRTARGERRALVPVADMFDHGRTDATWSYAVDHARFEIRAARDLVAGQEIQISYGRSANAPLVASYGFALADNPDDEVLLRLATADGERAVTVGTRRDRRFRLALALAAGRDPDDDDDDNDDGLAQVTAAARATIARLDAAPPATGDAAWRSLCERVRAGERAIAAAIVAGDLRPPD